MIKNLTTVALIGAFILSMSSGVAQSKDPAISKDNAVSIVFHVDGKKVSVQIDGDDTEVRVNGEVVAGDRAEVKGKTVTIKDDAGAPVAVVSRLGQGLSFARYPRSHRAAIGVEVGAIPDGLAEHLGLDAEDVIYVSGAVKGRAADKAGVRAHDVILEIDGESPVSERKLREVLKRKKPGSDLVLTILRRGQKTDIVVRCERAPGNWIYTPVLPNWNPRFSKLNISKYFRLDPGLVTTTTSISSGKKVADAFNAAIRALRAAQNKQSNKQSVGDLRAVLKAILKARSSSIERYKRLLERTFLYPNPSSKNLLRVGNHDYTYTWRGGLGAIKSKSKSKVPDKSTRNFVSSSNRSLSKKLDALQQRFDRLERLLEKVADRRENR